MTDIRELRQVFAAQAELAPDEAGLVEAARTGAIRLRRRRRIQNAFGAAMAAMLLTVAPMVIINIDRAEPPAEDEPRRPLQVTLELAAGSDYQRQEYGVVGVAQYLLLRRLDSDPIGFGAGVALYEPGAVDAAELLRGERITVRGHEAYYVPDFPAGQAIGFPDVEVTNPPSRLRDPEFRSSPAAIAPRLLDVRLPVIGWREPSGAWVVVFQKADKDSLARVAEDVRVGAARPVKAPLHLGHVPAGLAATVAVNFDVSVDSTPPPSSLIGFGAVGTPTLLDLRSADRLSFNSSALRISVIPRSEYVDSHVVDLGPPTTIAGWDTWYITEHDKGWLVPEHGSVMAVNVGACQAHIVVRDRNQIPYPELSRLVEDTTFADCTAPSTWTPPLP